MKGKMVILFLILLLSVNVSLSEAYEVIAVRSADIAPYLEAVEGFRKTCKCTLRDVNISGKDDGYLARLVKRESPDAVFAAGLEALVHAKAVTDIPVIYALVPNSAELIGGQKNISGVNMVLTPSQQLDTIGRLFPQAKRVGVLYDPDRTGQFVRDAAAAASERGIDLVLRTVHKPVDVPPQVDGLWEKVDVLWMLPDLTVVNREAFNYMLLFSFNNKVPVFTFSKKYVEMGAVASMTIIPLEIGAQAGEIARRVVKNGDITSPLREDARDSELFINTKVAEKMGLRIPEEILKRAKHVH